MGAAETNVTPRVVFTIGHSTRSSEAFIDLLHAHGIERVVDVRTVPRSARNPQFEQHRLSVTLQEDGIGYVHMAGLGGFRRPHDQSPNTGWRNPSFRGYADYMQTTEFAHALEECLALAARERLVLMCAEAVPWRCHRSLIADALIVRGVEVREISSAVRARVHTLTPFARVNGIRVTYP